MVAREIVTLGLRMENGEYSVTMEEEDGEDGVPIVCPSVYSPRDGWIQY